MAEAWAHHLKSPEIEAYSAGVVPKTVDPRTVVVMAEAGVDMSGYQSKNILDLLNIGFDYVITVCGHAVENCPVFPGTTKVIHVGFEDPPRLAAEAKTEEEALSHYRRVRDEIRKFVETLPDSLTRLWDNQQK